MKTFQAKLSKIKPNGRAARQHTNVFLTAQDAETANQKAIEQANELFRSTGAEHRVVRVTAVS